MTGLLHWHEATGVLTKIPLCKTILLHGSADAEREARKLFQRYPSVVLKADSPRLVHKSDEGFVITHLQAPGEVVSAYKRLSRKAYKRDPKADVLLQPQRPGVEVIIGAHRDPTFGPVVLCGLGGTLTNVYEDFSLRLCPVTTREAKEMLSELKAAKLLDGYRGSEVVDKNALARIIARLSRVMVETPQVASVDLNPVMATRQGASVVDAKVFTSPPPNKSGVRNVGGKGAVQRLLHPRSIAVIGASNEAGSVGNGLVKNLLTGGYYKTRYNKAFAGKVYPVNPHDKSVYGLQAYKSVNDIPGEVDLAVIAVPAPIVPIVLEECVAKKVETAAIISAGFAETGLAGKALQERIQSIARGHLRFNGPNSLGFIATGRFNASFAPASPPPGGVAFLSQSGAIIDSVIDWADATGYGFSTVISLGNAADLQLEDYFSYLAGDSETKAVAVYLEGVHDGARFVKAARALTRKKPLVVLKGGKTRDGSAAIASHTGSLAASYNVYKAAFHRARVAEARTITELFTLAHSLQNRPVVPRTGKGVAIVTNAGGVGVLLSDYCDAEGVPLVSLPKRLVKALDKTRVMHPAWSHRNPLDLVGDAKPVRYQLAISHLLRETRVSGLIVAQTLQTMTDSRADAELLIKAAVRSRKPIIACFMGGVKTRASRELLDKHGIPCFHEPQAAVRAMKALLASARRV